MLGFRASPHRTTEALKKLMNYRHAVTLHILPSKNELVTVRQIKCLILQVSRNPWYFCKYQGFDKEHGLSTGSFWKKLEDGQRPGSAARAHMCGPGVFAVILLITGRVISDIVNFRARSVTIVTCMYNYSKYWATLPLHWLKSAYN